MNTQRAFSLIEVLVTIAIVIILIFTAVPSIHYAILNNSITTKTNQLVSAVNFARSSAIAHQGEAEVIASSGEWGKGWDVYLLSTDADGNEHKELLRTFEYENDGILIEVTESKTSSEGKCVGNPVTSVLFQDSGKANTGDPEVKGYNICVCPKERLETPPRASGVPPGRRLRISGIGQVSLKKDKNGDNYSCINN